MHCERPFVAGSVLLGVSSGYRQRCSDERRVRTMTSEHAKGQVGDSVRGSPLASLIVYRVA